MTGTHESHDEPVSNLGHMRSIERSIKLLHCFSLEEPKLGVNELSRRTGVHKSTVSRLMASLEAVNFVRKDPESGQYALGVGLVKLAGLVLADLHIREISHPHLLQLARESEETVNLAVFDAEQVINVAQVPSSHSVKHLGRVGRPNPLNATSGGKLALAFMPEERSAVLIEQDWPKLTPHTLVSPDALRQEIEQVRRDGFAIARDEMEIGVSAVSAPIFGAEGEAVAFIGISGPTFRMPPDRIQHYAPLVKEEADAITLELGNVGLAQGD